MPRENASQFWASSNRIRVLGERQVNDCRLVVGGRIEATVLIGILRAKTAYRSATAVFAPEEGQV